MNRLTVQNRSILIQLLSRKSQRFDFIVYTRPSILLQSLSQFHGSSFLLSPRSSSPESQKSSHVSKEKNYEQQLLSASIAEMDQTIKEINRYIGSGGLTQQKLSIPKAILIVLLGLGAGWWAAEAFAWSLETVGLFIFQDDDDD